MKCCIDQPLNTTEKVEEDETQMTTEKSTTISQSTTSIPTSTEAKPLTTTSNVSKPNASASDKIDAPVKCPEVCVTKSMADYCPAIITTEGLCDPEFSCCVSLDTAKTQIPSSVIIPNKTGTNYSYGKHEEKTTPKPPLATTETRYEMTTVAHHTKSPKKQCRGECVSEYLAPLLCNYLDSEAECSDDGICCVLSAVGIIRTIAEIIKKTGRIVFKFLIRL